MLGVGRRNQANNKRELFWPWPNSLNPKSKINEFCEQIQSHIEQSFTGVNQSIQIQKVFQEPDQSYVIDITLVSHGIEQSCRLQRSFFNSGEYRKLVEFGNKTRDFLEDGAFVIHDNKKQSVRNFREVMEWLFENAKSGLSIQRYKGLGEMNPDQLWETTLNIETRRLLQVKVEDAVAADEIFSILMGDQVEPRRDFIETHALSVLNLDT